METPLEGDEQSAIECTYCDAEANYHDIDVRGYLLFYCEDHLPEQLANAR